MTAWPFHPLWPVYSPVRDMRQEDRALNLYQLRASQYVRLVPGSEHPIHTVCDNAYAINRKLFPWGDHGLSRPEARRASSGARAALLGRRGRRSRGRLGGARQRRSVDVQADVLVAERDHAGDAVGVAGREVVRQGDRKTMKLPCGQADTVPLPGAVDRHRCNCLRTGSRTLSGIAIEPMPVAIRHCGDSRRTLIRTAASQKSEHPQGRADLPATRHGTTSFQCESYVSGICHAGPFSALQRREFESRNHHKTV